MRYTPRRTRFVGPSPSTVVYVWPSPTSISTHLNMSSAQSSTPQTESSRPKQNTLYANSMYFYFLNNRLWTYRVGFLWKVCLVFAAERQLQPTKIFQFRDSNRISKEIISFQIKNIIRLSRCEGLQVIPWTLRECSEMDIESVIVCPRFF